MKLTNTPRPPDLEYEDKKVRPLVGNWYLFLQEVWQRILGFPSWVSGDTAITGDVTISNTGVTAIGATKIVDTMVNSGAVSILNPTGSIIMYGGASAPTGWVLCDGTSYDKTNATYTALFNIIGATFGGSGNNFNVPDMRGIYPKGAGTTNRAAGKDANGNYYAETLGAYVTDKMQGHKHTTYYGLYTTYAAANAGVPTASGTGIDTTTPIADGSNGTPRTGLTTEPQHVGLNYIIKL